VLTSFPHSDFYRDLGASHFAFGITFGSSLCCASPGLIFFFYFICLCALVLVLFLVLSARVPAQTLVSSSCLLVLQQICYEALLLLLRSGLCWQLFSSRIRFHRRSEFFSVQLPTKDFLTTSFVFCCQFSRTSAPVLFEDFPPPIVVSSRFCARSAPPVERSRILLQMLTHRVGL
jgi:hypothetical protein